MAPNRPTNFVCLAKTDFMTNWPTPQVVIMPPDHGLCPGPPGDSAPQASIICTPQSPCGPQTLAFY